MIATEILEALPDGVALLDADTGRVLEANTEFARQCGRTPEDLRRLPLWQLCPAFMVEAERARFLALPEGSRSWVMDVLRPDGSEIPLEVRARRIVLRGRRYVLAAARDVSTERTSERLLQGELDELRRLRRMISEGKVGA